MSKKITIALFFIFSLNTYNYGQSWWHPLNAGIVGDYGVLTEATYNGELYVGGWFYNAGNMATSNIARWSGWSWNTVGTGITGGENNVNVLCVYSGKLYVGGEFFAADGLAANNIASWDGVHWDTLSIGLKYCGGSGLGWADAMAVYNGKLYVGGAFCHAGNIAANNIACWDGTKWDSVSSGINDSVYALTVYNGNLYAGGQFTRAGNQAVNNIAYWDGTKWNAMGTGTNEPVSVLAEYNNALYAGGTFTSAGGTSVHNIASWNGTKWSAVGAGLTGSGVDAFCVFNGLLYTGGMFTKSGALVVNNIATWNGTAWDTVSTQGINNTVTSLAVLDSALYAGGVFTRAGNINAADIAAWGGVSLGINQAASRDVDVTVYPNPGNGVFTFTCHPPTGGSLPIIEVYNVLGERVLIETLRSTQGDNSINISNQPKGIYLYRLMDVSGQLINQGKIIVQ